MDQVAKMSLYYDFYGGLLTSKQQRVFSLYYMENFSLAEIAEEEGTTRQAVHDLLQRTEKLLERWEKELALVARYLKEKRAVGEIKESLEELGRCLSGQDEAYRRFLAVRKKVMDLEAHLEG
ncbi:MAG: YlxM family DNA-binding protein [Clostridia bacterium]|nr:YlxM family DNA-binding protein [Clostridia bacterium]